MVDWLVDAWPWLVPLAATLLATLANVITRHPDHATSWVGRLALAAIDILAWLQSVGSMRRGFKLPATRSAPAKERMVR
jgi:hypothetical protein